MSHADLISRLQNTLTQQLEAFSRAAPPTSRNGLAAAMAEIAESNREAIYAALVRAGKPCSCAELADITGMSREGVHEHLRKMAERGTVQNISLKRGAIYVPAHHRNARIHLADPAWLDGLEEAA